MKTEAEGGRKWSLSCSQEQAFFLRIHFNSILPSTPRCYWWSLFFRLSKQHLNVVFFSMRRGLIKRIKLKGEYVQRKEAKMRGMEE
jgi:hypothetical protein